MLRLAPCALVFATAAAQATPYVFVEPHSQGVVRWTHLGFSHPFAQINRIQGRLDWNAAEPTRSTVQATIPMANLATGVPDLDEDFASAAFFDFAHYTAATFTSTRVEAGAGPGRLRLTGDLALHGVTKPMTLDVVLNKVGTNPRNDLPTVGFEATATLKRSDFGLGKFVPQVSDEVRLEFTVEAVDAAANAAYEKAQEDADKAAQAGRGAQTK
jgi:polyisoprenoid-binding protein YceI